LALEKLLWGFENLHRVSEPDTGFSKGQAHGTEEGIYIKTHYPSLTSTPPTQTHSWLLAAFATLCERPAFILNCFLTRSFSFRGKYQVRLYDQKKGCFVTITIDDYIPCNKRTGMVRSCPVYLPPSRF
jgi:hypothetical protein